MLFMPAFQRIFAIARYSVVCDVKQKVMLCVSMKNGRTSALLPSSTTNSHKSIIHILLKWVSTYYHVYFTSRPPAHAGFLPLYLTVEKTLQQPKMTENQWENVFSDKNQPVPITSKGGKRPLSQHYAGMQHACKQLS